MEKRKNRKKKKQEETKEKKKKKRGREYNRHILNHICPCCETQLSVVFINVNSV